MTLRPLRIIIVMVEAPVPFGNAAARWFYVLLKELVKRGHHVTAFATCSKPSEMEKARSLFPSSQYDLRLYPMPTGSNIRGKWQSFRRPFSNIFSHQLKSDLKIECEKGFDILH